MKEIKVGEHVRTFNGLIGKVVQLTDSGNYVIRIYNGAEYVVRAVIAKRSKNIIDLIEVGDIVEIELSEEFAEKEDKRILTQIGEVYTKETLQKDIDNGIITKILTILTKEQYMQNCYTVERKEKC